MSDPVNIHIFQTPEDLVAAAADAMRDHLAAALDVRGGASLMLSGGSSPKPVYERLFAQSLAWDGVGIGLVDERWVPSGADGSNADFIKGCLADTPAERAHFVPLYNGHANAAAGVAAAEQLLASMSQPFDLCVMGMGMDGHTASWFPRSGGLAAALDPNGDALLCAIDATGCQVAGSHTDRITLTYAAIARARQVILLLPSAEKFDLFQRAADLDVMDAPVRALYDLGATLSVFGLETPS